MMVMPVAPYPIPAPPGKPKEHSSVCSRYNFKPIPEDCPKERIPRPTGKLGQWHFHPYNCLCGCLGKLWRNGKVIPLLIGPTKLTPEDAAACCKESRYEETRD
jgi:hypothetical protein